MKSFFSYFATSLIFFALLVAGGYSLYKSSIFNLQEINYEYAKSKSADSYIQTLKPSVELELKKLIGQSLWKIDILKIEQSLLSKPWIKNVSITRNFPNKITIRIESKEFIADILSSPSQLRPVAEDSTIMSAVDISKSPVTPILSHPLFVTNKNLRKAALDFLKQLPKEGSFSAKNISEILPLKKNANLNSSFKVLMKNSNVIVLIDDQNVSLKAERVSRVMDYLSDKEMEDRIIDANFSKKVLVRPRNHR